MLNFLIKCLINDKIPHTKTNIEEILYDKEVYPQYVVTSHSFNYAIKNRLLNRQDILQIKQMLNKALFKHQHLKDYQSHNFQNDAHEIYTKLKSKYLSRQQLIKIDKYINKVIFTKESTIKNSTLTEISQS